MSFVDSLDSILMLYSYTGFAERSLAIFDHEVPALPGAITMSAIENLRKEQETPTHVTASEVVCATGQKLDIPAICEEGRVAPSEGVELRDELVPNQEEDGYDLQQLTRNSIIQRSTMSNLSLALTLMSILVAFRSVIYFREHRYDSNMI
jgi:nickel/cobalt transporter (NiCoT) family protein